MTRKQHKLQTYRTIMLPLQKTNPFEKLVHQRVKYLGFYLPDAIPTIK